MDNKKTIILWNNDWTPEGWQGEIEAGSQAWENMKNSVDKIIELPVEEQINQLKWKEDWDNSFWEDLKDITHEELLSYIESNKAYLKLLISEAQALISELESMWIGFEKPLIPDMPKFDDFNNAIIESINTYADLSGIIKYLLSKKWIEWEDANKYIELIG